MTDRIEPIADHLQVAMDVVVAVAFEWDVLRDEVRRLASAEEALPATGGQPERFEDVVRVVHPGDRSRFRADVERALKSGTYLSEYRIVRSDGEVRWLAESGRVDFDADRRPLRLIGISQDVTERKRVQAQLAAREELYRHLLNSIDQGFCVLQTIDDAQGRAVDYRFLEVNATFERHTGFANPVGRTARELVPGLEQSWIDIYGRVADTGVTARFTQGSAVLGRMYNVQAVRVGEPAARTVALLFSDITETERMTQALRDSEARYRRLFASSPQPMWVVDMQTLRIIEVNDAAVAHFGHDREAFATLTVPDLMVPRERARLVQRSAEVGEQPLMHHGVWRMQCRDGREIDVEVSSHRLQHDGHVHRLVLLSDVTERLRVEAQLRENMAELEAADRRKDHFLAMLGHELRNPLAPIVNSAQILRLAGSDARAVEAAAELIERQARHLSRLLDDLLDVARITEGKIVLKKARIDLAPLLYQALESVRTLTEAQGHRLVVHPPREPALVDGDSARLVQVLTNLLANAAKYTLQGGRIEVWVEVEATQVRVRVRDNGIGLSEEVRRRLFEPFVQAREARERAQGGLGLGLALVRRLVELHGGSVEAASAGPGQGSEFTVLLPRAAEPDDAAPRAPQAAASAGTPLRWMVVDDNADAADSMALLLRASGQQAFACHDPFSALAAYAARRPQAVMLDIGLPGIDGYELLRRLRSEAGGAPLFAAALTGYCQPSDQARSRAAGFDRHLVKPLAPEALSKLIDEAQSRLQAEAGTGDALGSAAAPVAPR